MTNVTHLRYLVVLLGLHCLDLTTSDICQIVNSYSYYQSHLYQFQYPSISNGTLSTPPSPSSEVNNSLYLKTNIKYVFSSNSSVTDVIRLPSTSLISYSNWSHLKPCTFDAYKEAFSSLNSLANLPLSERLSGSFSKFCIPIVRIVLYRLIP